MGFQKFLSRSWDEHGAQTAAVAKELPRGIELITQSEDIAPMAALITHVMGQHLARWNDGILLLEKLKRIAAFQPGSEAEKAVSRGIAILRTASGDAQSLPFFTPTEQIRVMAGVAAALIDHELARAQKYFLDAVEKAGELDPQDPGVRALAIAGNNMAQALEDLPDRSAAQIELMILAAEAARKHWGIAGGWLEVERAEYRLAMSYLKAGDLNQALIHAKQCLDVCRKNDAPEVEMFFAHEALALVQRQRQNVEAFSEAMDKMRELFQILTPEDRQWCRSTFDKFLN
ncbi:MAG TPA: hypothetical protein PKC28_01315 [Bdellovibrionales bacterium]|nr:hypothetical protein [Bdellovibrionales bacterium]